jgi:hypothetical protein
VDNGALDNPSYGTPEALASISKILPPETRWLKVEYQTLRRLPGTGYILFTIRTFLYVCPPAVREVYCRMLTPPRWHSLRQGARHCACPLPRRRRQSGQ